MALFRTGAGASGGIVFNGKYHYLCNNGEVLSGDVSSSFTIQLTSTQSSTNANALVVDTKNYSSITITSNIALFNPQIFGIESDGTMTKLSESGTTSVSGNVTDYDAIIWIARVDGLTQVSVSLS